MRWAPPLAWLLPRSAACANLEHVLRAQLEARAGDDVPALAIDEHELPDVVEVGDVGALAGLAHEQPNTTGSTAGFDNTTLILLNF